MTYRRQIVFILAMACMILMSACGAAKPSSDREDASAQTPTVSVTAASSTAEEKTEASEEAAGLVEFIRFRADTTEIRVGQTANVTFSAEITENSLVSEPIALECETDGVIAELKDDGILPDLTAGDGVFTAALALQSAERKNEYYRASCRNDHSEAVQICFYRDLTQKDYDQMDSVLGEISERDEFEKITAYLTDNPDIEYWTEDKEHSSITFTTTAGLYSSPAATCQMSVLSYRTAILIGILLSSDRFMGRTSPGMMLKTVRRVFKTSWVERSLLKMIMM